MSPKKKNLTPNDLGEMIGHVVRTIGDLPTKDDVREIVREELKPVETRLEAIEGKVAGIDRRLDTEAMRRDDERIPARVANIEKKVFGASQGSAHR